MIFIAALLFLFARQVLTLDDEPAITVKTEDGILTGTTYETINGRTLTAFLGVPYAAPPVDERRFMVLKLT